MVAQVVVFMTIELIQSFITATGFAATVVVVIFKEETRRGRKCILGLAGVFAGGGGAIAARCGGALTDVVLIDEQAGPVAITATACCRVGCVFARSPAGFSHDTRVVPRSINRVAVGGKAVNFRVARLVFTHHIAPTFGVEVMMVVAVGGVSTTYVHIINFCKRGQ